MTENFEKFLRDHIKTLGHDQIQKIRLERTEGFLIDEFKICQDISDMEFTEEFAQKQLKALNFLNRVFRRKFKAALAQESNPSDELGQMLSGAKLTLACKALIRQMQTQFDIMERCRKMGYNVKIYSEFAMDELVDLEEKRIHLLNDWEDKNAEECKQ